MDVNGVNLGKRFAVADNLEKFVDVEAEAKATVDHVKCCNCFSKANMKKINICKSKCRIINFIKARTKSFLRKITPE